MDEIEKLNNLFNLHNKIAIVTGGGTGIGFMISKGLVLKNVKVYIIGRREEKLKEAVIKLNELIPNKSDYIVGDISNKKEVKLIYDKFVNDKKETKLNILINNAGIFNTNYNDFLAEDVWKNTMEVNCLGPIYMIDQFKNIMKNNINPNSIINISSINTKLLVADLGFPYSVSKAALEYYSKVMAARLSHENINLNVIQPGPFFSELLTKDLPIIKDFIEKTPDNKIGEYEDIIGIIITLVSKAGSHIKGQVISVDGGYTLTNNSIGI